MGERDRGLKIREAADALGLDYGAIRGAIERGALPAERHEGSFRIRPEDLAAYRDANRGRAPVPDRSPPAEGPPASPELDEARHYAMQARRWTRKAAINPTRRSDEGGPKPG